MPTPPFQNEKKIFGAGKYRHLKLYLLVIKQKRQSHSSETANATFVGHQLERYQHVSFFRT